MFFMALRFSLTPFLHVLWERGLRSTQAVGI